MTITKIIDIVDGQKPNAYSDGQKKHWIGQLDAMAFRDVISTHEGGPESFTPYDGETDGDTEVLMDDGRADVYVYWVSAMIDFANQETTRYTNDMIMFNTQYGDWCSWYNRTHMPLTHVIKGANTRVIR